MAYSDLVFLHPPSVYDFRKKTVMFGPIADVIPSSPVFEMYPVGMTSIADYLERHGFTVRIINLAYQMARNESYDVEKAITGLNPVAFGVDLHWLPHVQGSLEVARIIKGKHPETPVIFGGLSSTYFHRELLQYPWIDYVVRGDCTEEPIRQLLTSLKYGRRGLEQIPNLSWKRSDGTIVSNPLTYIPGDLDYVDVPGYRYVMRSVLRYRRLHESMPYLEWLDYPTTMLLTARGCTQGCAICGGSVFGCLKVCRRKKPAYRSPEKLVEDIKFIQSFSRAPIFVVHDIRQAGPEYAARFLQLLRKAGVTNEIVFELFEPAGEEFFRQIEGAVPRYSLEMSIESHLERIRKVSGKFSCSNSEIEATIRAALDCGCRKIDLFFMVGLPGQSHEDATGAVEFTRRLVDRLGGDRRLVPFVAPLAPFLDPGSLAYEEPERFGYIRLCHTLEDHIKAMEQPSWKHMLSYETELMNRDDIVRATYDAAAGFNRLKYEYGIIDERVYREVESRIARSLEVLAEIDRLMLLPPEQMEEGLRELRSVVRELNRHSLCGEEELKWPISKRFANVFSWARVFLSVVAEDVSRRTSRLFSQAGLRLPRW